MIPIDLVRAGKETLGVEKQSDIARLIRRAVAVFQDEAPMLDGKVYAAISRSFQDIRECISVFGGITMVLGGDFRQILPVVPRGGRDQQV